MITARDESHKFQICTRTSIVQENCEIGRFLMQAVFQLFFSWICSVILCSPVIQFKSDQEKKNVKRFKKWKPQLMQVSIIDAWMRPTAKRCSRWLAEAETEAEAVSDDWGLSLSDLYRSCCLPRTLLVSSVWFCPISPKINISLTLEFVSDLDSFFSSSHKTFSS